MSPDLKQKVQILLGVAVVLAAGRTAYIFYERSNYSAPAAKKELLLDPDYYVTPKKLRAYDLKDAKALTNGPVWVRDGYRYTYFPYDRARRHTDFKHEAGLLLPIEKLQITDVVLDNTPGAADQKQMLAVFEREGKSYAFAFGVVKEGSYQIYADDMLFLQDPHELYKHWQAEVWDAVDKHEARVGMKELQMELALGLGVLKGSGLGSERVIQYPNGGKPLTIVFQEGRAVEIKPGG
jgi:hypothetical protein